MEDKIKIFLADDDINFVYMLKAVLDSEPDMKVVGTAYNGKDTVADLTICAPDILLLDLVMPGCDGIQVLKKIKTSVHHQPKVIVLTALPLEVFMQQAKNLISSINYYFMKPFNNQHLLNIIREVFIAPLDPVKKEIKPLNNTVLTILRDIGVPPNFKGRLFSYEAVVMLNERPELICALTKKLYPLFAEKYGTTPGCVERAIRTVIDKVWERKVRDEINEFFGECLKNVKDKPTNSQFLMGLADKANLLNK